MLRTGWGTYLQDLSAIGVCTKEEINLHINILEMKVIQLALTAFRDQIMGESVDLMSDNATVVAYMKKQGGTVFQILCDLAQEILTSAEQLMFCLTTRYILGKKNILSD